MTRWYFSQKGEAQGPFSEEEFKDLLKSRQVGLFDLVFCEGQVSWKKISEFPEWVAFLKTLETSVAVEDYWVVLARRESKLQQMGPYSTQEVKERLKRGDILYADHIWKEGMKEWVKVADLSVLSGPEPEPVHFEEIKKEPIFQLPQESAEELLKSVVEVPVLPPEVPESFRSEPEPPPPEAVVDYEEPTEKISEESVIVNSWEEDDARVASKPQKDELLERLLRESSAAQTKPERPAAPPRPVEPWTRQGEPWVRSKTKKSRRKSRSRRRRGAVETMNTREFNDGGEEEAKPLLGLGLLFGLAGILAGIVLFLSFSDFKLSKGGGPRKKELTPQVRRSPIAVPPTPVAVEPEPLPKPAPEKPVVKTPPVAPKEPVVKTPPVAPKEPVVKTPPVTPKEPVVKTPPVAPKEPVVKTPPVAPKEPEVKKIAPTYLKVETRGLSDGAPEVVFKTDGSSHYQIKVNLVGRAGEIVGGKSYFKDLSRPADKRVVLKLKDLGLREGSYTLIANCEGEKAQKSFFIGKKSETFNDSLRLHNKQLQFFHEQERWGLFSGGRSLLKLAFGLEAKVADDRLSPQKRQQALDQWKKIYRSARVRAPARGQASNFFYPDIWWQLSDIYQNLGSLGAALAKAEKGEVQRIKGEITKAKFELDNLVEGVSHLYLWP